MNERKETESEHSLADALERSSEGSGREDRIEGKIESGRIPFEELDEHGRLKEKGE